MFLTQKEEKERWGWEGVGNRGGGGGKKEEKAPTKIRTGLIHMLKEIREGEKPVFCSHSQILLSPILPHNALPAMVFVNLLLFFCEHCWQLLYQLCGFLSIFKLKEKKMDIWPLCLYHH